MAFTAEKWFQLWRKCDSPCWASEFVGKLGFSLCFSVVYSILCIELWTEIIKEVILHTIYTLEYFNASAFYWPVFSFSWLHNNGLIKAEIISPWSYNGRILKWKEEISPLKYTPEFIITTASMYYHWTISPKWSRGMQVCSSEELDPLPILVYVYHWSMLDVWSLVKYICLPVAVSQAEATDAKRLHQLPRVQHQATSSGMPCAFRFSTHTAGCHASSSLRKNKLNLVLRDGKI